MYLAATIQSKIIDFLPMLCTFVCFGLSIVCFVKGLTQLVARYRLLKSGLHASSTLCRHQIAGEDTYLPVYSYTGENGEQFDLLDETAYKTEQEALGAHRPLVYADERPDAAVSRGPLFLFIRPVCTLILSGVFAWGMYYAICSLPD